MRVTCPVCRISVLSSLQKCDLDSEQHGILTNCLDRIAAIEETRRQEIGAEEQRRHEVPNQRSSVQISLNRGLVPLHRELRPHHHPQNLLMISTNSRSVSVSQRSPAVLDTHPLGSLALRTAPLDTSTLNRSPTDAPLSSARLSSALPPHTRAGPTPLEPSGRRRSTHRSVATGTRQRRSETTEASDLSIISSNLITQTEQVNLRIPESSSVNDIQARRVSQSRDGRNDLQRSISIIPNSLEGEANIVDIHHPLMIHNLDDQRHYHVSGTALNMTLEILFHVSSVLQYETASSAQKHLFKTIVEMLSLTALSVS